MMASDHKSMIDVWVHLTMNEFVANNQNFPLDEAREKEAYEEEFSYTINGEFMIPCAVMVRDDEYTKMVWEGKKSDDDDNNNNDDKDDEYDNSEEPDR